MLIHQKRDPQWEWSFLFTDKIPFKNLKASNGFVLKKQFQGMCLIFKVSASGPLALLFVLVIIDLKSVKAPFLTMQTKCK